MNEIIPLNGYVTRNFFHFRHAMLLSLLDSSAIVLRAASPAFCDNKAETALSIVQNPVSTVTAIENATSKSTMIGEHVYWNNCIMGLEWYDLIQDPMNVVKRVSTILLYSDSTHWMLFRGTASTLEELRRWAKASRHFYRQSPGRGACAIKCSDITGVWDKWEDVKCIAIVLKKAYDDGDHTISVKYTNNKLVKNKLFNLNFI